MQRVIASCVYGNKHTPFVFTFLYSVTKTCPDARIIIGYYDFSLVELNLLKISYPFVEFISLDNTNSKGLSHAANASQKIKTWFQLFDLHTKENDQILFLDIDTLMIKSPFEIFTSDIDLVLTRKKGKWPLNSGVLFVCKNANTQTIFYNWLILTNKIISSVYLNSQAEASYGGADQDALIKTLGISKCIIDFDLDTYIYAYLKSNVKIKFVNCEEYNQTESAKITPLTKIIHYKAGWHNILINGARYTKNRPKSSSFEFHQIWKNCYTQAKNILYESVYKKSWEQEDLVKEVSEIKYLPRGIYNSEMLLMISVLKFLNVETVLESGRARGHSTQLISKLLQNDDLHKSLISLDFKKDSDSEYAETNLAQYPKTKLIYGDANFILKKIVRKNFSQSDRYAVLLDGPKSFNALYLTAKLIRSKIPPVVLFIHDMKKIEKDGKFSLQRYMCSVIFDRVFFSDEFQIKPMVRMCDESIFLLSDTTWLNNVNSPNFIFRESYGPTLAVIFPTLLDRHVLKKIFIWPVFQFYSIYSTVSKFILLSIFNRLRIIVFWNK
jgi:hypothetical protein